MRKGRDSKIENFWKKGKGKINKIKMKEVSDKIKSKMITFNEATRKVAKIDDKIVVNEVKDLKTLSLIKESLKENVHVKDKMEAKANEVDNTDVEADKMVEVRNTFEIMLESSRQDKLHLKCQVKRKRDRRSAQKT